MSNPTLYSETKRKSRKEKICHGCYNKIGKGDKYIAIKGLWDGGWDNYTHCLDCNKKMAEMISAGQPDDIINIENITEQWIWFTE
jgi:hypothetical protein